MNHWQLHLAEGKTSEVINDNKLLMQIQYNEEYIRQSKANTIEALR